MTQVTSDASRLDRYRTKLKDLREQVRVRMAAGGTGVHLVATYNAGLDQLLNQIFEETLSNRTDSESLLRDSAIVAVGGTGRSECAPYSDLDLLFLEGSKSGEKGPAQNTGEQGSGFAQFASQVVRDLWDTGFKLGHSIQTFPQAIRMAEQDPHFATALVDCRPLWGNEALVDKLRSRFFRRIVRPRAGRFIRAAVAERRKELEEFGVAGRELEPDVKRSAGGLRDLHLLRWIGYSQFGTSDLGLLKMHGLIDARSFEILSAAYEFLLRLRMTIHLAAGRPSDTLTREEQVRIAELWNYEATGGQVPVERFMQVYFRHTTAVAKLVHRFVARFKKPPVVRRVLNSLATHRSDMIYRIGPVEIDVVSSKRESVCGRMESLLKLIEAMSLNQVVPSQKLTDAMERAAPNLPTLDHPELARRFLTILKRGKFLGRLLRTLQETGILVKLLPEFAHAECLLQFNQYHKFTVDEHTIRAVEACIAFEEDPGPLGIAYRAIHRKDILHLALLLHDLGKGYEEDHSDVGKRLATELATRWGLSDHDREVLVFLVHKHLAMALLAFRRDIFDSNLVLSFSKEVGSIEILRSLYVLTAADITAVGPGVWTSWKGELLTTLFEHISSFLSGQPTAERENRRVREVWSEVRELIGQTSKVPDDWVEATLDSFPAQFLLQSTKEQIAETLLIIKDLGAEEIVVRTTFDPARQTHEYRIVLHEPVVEGCFSKMAGALAAKGLEILEAQINTSRQGIVLDSFRVVDRDYSGEVPSYRYEEVAETIRNVLQGKISVEELFRSNRRFQTPGSDVTNRDPSRVVVDNDTSPHHTIIDVFTYDRPGLLYRIAWTLWEQGLSVSLAKISTHLDQVVDVFYVTDREGGKIASDRLEGIRESLLDSIKTEN